MDRSIRFGQGKWTKEFPKRSVVFQNPSAKRLLGGYGSFVNPKIQTPGRQNNPIFRRSDRAVSPISRAPCLLPKESEPLPVDMCPFNPPAPCKKRVYCGGCEPTYGWISRLHCACWGIFGTCRGLLNGSCFLPVSHGHFDQIEASMLLV